MPATLELDAACAEAVELARAAAVRRAGVLEVGEHVEVYPEDTRVATHLFECGPGKVLAGIARTAATHGQPLAAPLPRHASAVLTAGKKNGDRSRRSSLGRKRPGRA